MRGNDEKNVFNGELVALAAAGDRKARERLIEAALPIIRTKASKYAGSGLSADDLVQEGNLAFVDALKGFDPSRGASFATYAETCVDNRMISAVRSNFNRKNAALSNAAPFTLETADPDADPANIVSERYDSEHIRKFLDADLSEFERRVLELRFLKKSYSQIASELGRGVKAVDNALQRIRKKTRDKFYK